MLVINYDYIFYTTKYVIFYAFNFFDAPEVLKIKLFYFLDIYVLPDYSIGTYTDNLKK